MAIAGHSCDDTTWSYLTHPRVVKVRDVDIARGIHGEIVRVVELGIRRWAAIAHRRTRTDHGGNRATRPKHSNPLIVAVGDKKVSGRVHSDCNQPGELRLQSGSPVSQETVPSGSRDRGDDAASIHAPHAI